MGLWAVGGNSNGKESDQNHRPPSTVDEVLNIVVTLIPAINKFFDEVLVMAEDAALRGNRLALLAQLDALMNQVADISKLSA